jgi:hypothetical protein
VSADGSHVAGSKPGSEHLHALRIGMLPSSVLVRLHIVSQS